MSINGNYILELLLVQFVRANSILEEYFVVLCTCVWKIKQNNTMAKSKSVSSGRHQSALVSCFILLATFIWNFDRSAAAAATKNVDYEDSVVVLTHYNAGADVDYSQGTQYITYIFFQIFTLIFVYRVQNY